MARAVREASSSRGLGSAGSVGQSRRCFTSPGNQEPVCSFCWSREPGNWEGSMAFERMVLPRQPAEVGYLRRFTETTMLAGMILKRQSGMQPVTGPANRVWRHAPPARPCQKFRSKCWCLCLRAGSSRPRDICLTQKAIGLPELVLLKAEPLKGHAAITLATRLVARVAAFAQRHGNATEENARKLADSFCGGLIRIGWAQ